VFSCILEFPLSKPASNVDGEWNVTFAIFVISVKEGGLLGSEYGSDSAGLENPSIYRISLIFSQLANESEKSPKDGC
jgi:hypothetical protein